MPEFGSVADWFSVLIASAALIFAARSFRNSKRELKLLVSDRERDQAADVYYTAITGGSSWTLRAVNSSNTPVYNFKFIVGIESSNYLLGCEDIGVLGPGEWLDIEVEPYGNDVAAHILLYFRDAYGRFWRRNNFELMKVDVEEVYASWGAAKGNGQFPPGRWVVGLNASK